MKLLVSLCLAIGLVFSCNQKEKAKKAKFDNLRVTNLNGKELAHIHCASCHAFVEPELLPRASWKDDVLPAMGNRLGIFNGDRQPDSIFGSPLSRPIVKKANIFPERPLLARADWLKLVQYYIENSSDSLIPGSKYKPIKKELEHFQYKEPQYVNRPPFTSMVKIRSGNKGLVFADSKRQGSRLTFLTPNLKKEADLSFQNTPIDYYEKGDTVYLTTIGRNIFPSDFPGGGIQKVSFHEAGTPPSPGTTIVSELQRPVDMAYGDLTGNGLEDIVVCEYGNLTGKLTWLKNLGNNSYQRNVLKTSPGAISAIIKDYNNDGRNDFFVLMAQGDEGVFYYENLGDGTFSEKRILTFSPLNGSQYIELADFNKDGLDDIVYVCGDNADKTPILKDYHGVYIYINDGNFTFEQRYFYPLNGAYKAMARDYDLDGDLDIATISYFPDYLDRPEESFVYLKNQGDLKFEAYTFPQSPKGRWIVMDAGDIDADGDIDLALGSFVYFLAKGDTTGLSKRWLTESPSVILLENTIKP
jgi:hypothetical protein